VGAECHVTWRSEWEVEVGQFAAQIFRENLSAGERGKSLEALSAEWDAEDATDDPQELTRRRMEWGGTENGG